MTDLVLHAMPRTGGVVREQVRAVGIGLRRPALGVVALLALATLLFVSEFMRDGAAFNFHPERWVVPGLAGLLLPIAVWQGEDRFGAGFLWTLPVDRRTHALAKVCAGWVWLMAAVALFVLWLLLLSRLSGGNVGGEETLRMVSGVPLRELDPVDPAVIRLVKWTPNPLLFLAPFTAATTTHLFASALALAARSPFRWIVVGAMTFLLIVTLAEADDAERLDPVVDVVEHVAAGRYGLESVIVAGTEGIKVETSFPNGERVVVWRGLPDAGRWAAATLIWASVALVLLLAAASRHRERRRR